MRFLRRSLLFLLPSSAAGFLLPDPSGPYNVTLATNTLADHSRHITSNGKTVPRALMLSVFQPANCKSTAPALYMPDEVANFQGPFLQDALEVPLDLTPVFRQARLPLCAVTPETCSTYEDAPVLLFAPGYSIPRYYYNVLASALASQGFTVITFDSPNDANIIVYPNGDVVYNNDTEQNLDVIKKQISPVARDYSFIVDQLSNATAMGELLPRRGARPISPNHVAVMGHSLGGVAAVIAAGQDSRIRGAINWDGSFLQKPPPPGVKQPVLLMSHGFADDSWPAAWPLLKGPKLWVNVANTTHYTFSDMPTLLQSAGQEVAGVAELLGTINPATMRKILVDYSTAWMKDVFEGKLEWPLLKEKFAKVEVVRRRNF